MNSVASEPHQTNRLAFGLRSKSLLALGVAFALALLVATVIGWRAIGSLQDHFASVFARNATLLSEQRILAPVARELALSRRLAASQVTLGWLHDIDNQQAKALFFREAESYRRDFVDQSYFLIDAARHDYYFNDNRDAFSDQPRYRVDADKPENKWFFATMAGADDVTINVDPDVYLKVTKVWFNIIVRDGEQKLGLAGTGLDLTHFLQEFLGNAEPGVTPMILDAEGHIQAHPDPQRIAYTSGAGLASEQTIYRLLDAEGGRQLREALSKAAADPSAVLMMHVLLEGHQQLLALSYLPELKWHIVTAVDLEAAQVIDLSVLLPLAAAAGIALLALIAGFLFGVNRLVIAPLGRLTQSARSLADGRYDIQLPKTSDDEIGVLTTSFARMAQRIRSHTEELETTVAHRTRELVKANTDMAEINRKIGDSIDYASLIQRALLPDRELRAALGARCSVLWQPRDVVGGDFYLFRQDEKGVLLGVVDCAGHGVPGALMTMLAWAAFDQAINEVGLDDPAALLRRADATVRAMVQIEAQGLTVATNMDVGLVYVPHDGRKICFAGAKLPLYWVMDGDDTVHQIPGGRRAVAGKRAGEYSNTVVELSAPASVYLASDGVLDQDGGESGYAFGTTRLLHAILTQCRHLPSQQTDALATMLAAYRGVQNQRDDITLICLRVGDLDGKS